MRSFWVALALVAVCIPAPAFSGLLFDSPEFQINTYTTGNQSGAVARSVARSPDGSFVVVWTGGSPPDFSGPSVQGQRFDSAGVAAGTEFQVNTYTTYGQTLPAAAAAGDGSFVVVWESNLQDGSGASIQGQRFDSAGVAAGTEFQINTLTVNDQLHSAVSGAGDGSFVVVWESYNDSTIRGQRFDSSGAAAGTELDVSTNLIGLHKHAAVAVAGDGSFVVVWESYPQDGSYFGVFGQRFDSAGAPAGTAFQVNTYTTGSQLRPAVAVNGAAGFVVVWHDYTGQDGSDAGLFGQRFDSTGAPAGTEFQVNTYTTGSQYGAAVSCAGDDSFLVVWGSDSQDQSVIGQRFDSVGAPAGTEFQINTYTTLAQNKPSVAVDAAGDFVVVWTSLQQDFNVDGMFGQRLCEDADTNLICDSQEGTTTTTTTTTTSTSTTTTLPPTTTTSTSTTTTSSTMTTTTLDTLCGPTPEPDLSCRLADPLLGPGKSSLQIGDDPDSSKDSLRWKWNKGVGTALADFKMPDTAAATYRLCIYDASSAAQPLAEMEVPNGGVVPTCGTRPCWKAKPTGYTYKNEVGTPDGITNVKFKAGAPGSGKAQVQIKGRGALLGPPVPVSLENDVVIQLLIDDGISTVCFKTSFPGTSGSGSAVVYVKPPSSLFRGKGP